MDDQTRELIERAQNQDREAMEALFSRYRERLHRAVRRLIGPGYRASIGDSEDAAQDAILSSLSRIKSFDYDGEGSFLAWLLRGADFQIKSQLRAWSTQKRGGNRVRSLEGNTSQLPVESQTPSGELQGQEAEERLADCLRRLPRKECEIILLRRYLDLATDEICQELDLPSPGAARALLSRAQAHLAGLLGR